MITLRLVGITNVVAGLNVARDLQRPVILGLSQVAFDTAQRGAGRHTKTGALFSSLYNRALSGDSRAVGHDPQRAPHAVFVNLGTRPHEIRPKRRKALRWATPNGFRFAGVVRHPGYRGDAYLIEGATDALRQLSSIVDAAMRR